LSIWQKRARDFPEELVETNNRAENASGLRRPETRPQMNADVAVGCVNKPRLHEKLEKIYNSNI